MQTTLRKWGNSQGILIPREICVSVDINVGDTFEFEIGEDRTILLRPEASHYHRNTRASLEELTAGWAGPRAGEEWGGHDVGNEVVA